MSHFPGLNPNSSQLPYTFGQTPSQPTPPQPTQSKLHPRFTSLMSIPSFGAPHMQSTSGFNGSHVGTSQPSTSSYSSISRSSTSSTSSSYWNKELPASCWQPVDKSILACGWMQPILNCSTSQEVRTILRRHHENIHELGSAQEILLLAALIGSMEFNDTDTKHCYDAFIFSSGVRNLPASEKGTLIKYASISKYPHADVFRNAIGHQLYLNFPTSEENRWPSEQQKLQTLIREIKRLKIEPGYLDSFEFNFDKRLLANSFDLSLSLLKHKCQALLKNLANGKPVHLPKYYFDLGARPIQPNNLKSISGDSGLAFTQEINPTQHGTILAFPSHFEWASDNFKIEAASSQLKIPPNETVILEPTISGKPWAFCGAVQRYDVITALWVGGDFNFAQIDDSLFLTNWQCALMSAILKKNYPILVPKHNPTFSQLAASPPPLQPPKPKSFPPLSSQPQPLPTLNRSPLPTPRQPVTAPSPPIYYQAAANPLNLQSTNSKTFIPLNPQPQPTFNRLPMQTLLQPATVPTITQTAVTTSTVALGKVLTPKKPLNTSIEQVLKYLKTYKNRTLRLQTFNTILEINELTANQKIRLDELLNNPANSTVHNTHTSFYKEYHISITAIIEILGGKSEIQQNGVKVIHHPTPPSSLSSSSSSTSTSFSSSNWTTATTTTSSTQAAFSSVYPTPQQSAILQQSATLKRPVPSGAHIPQAQRPKTEFTPDKRFTQEEMKALQEISKKVEDNRSSQEQILLFIYQLHQGRELSEQSKEILRLSKRATPDDFYTAQYPYLNPIQKGDVGQKFWASQAYSAFRIERFIELSHVNPELFREATMEGIMNTYCQRLHTAESKDATDLVSGKKTKSEHMIKEAKTLFNLSDGPPAYRQVWHDHDNDDVSLYGKVVGYNPEFLFDTKPVQTLLLYTILNVSQSDRNIIESAYVTLEDDDTQKAAALVAYEILKNSQEGSAVQLQNRDCILCSIPAPEDAEWQEKHQVIVDYNTFDRTEMHGRNLRLNPNEPHFLWKLFGKLTSQEQQGLHQYIIDQKDNPDLDMKKVDLVYRFLLDMANAIKDRYFSRVELKNGRRSSPMKIPNDPIFEALNGARLEDIKQLETFEEAIHNYPIQ